MKKIFCTLLLVAALASWSVAQTATTNATNDNVTIKSGPTVDTSDHSATIRWSTDDLAATVVKYGADKNNLNKESRISGGARDHKVTLSELQPNTTYFYAIMTQDGQTRTSGQFTTKGAATATTSTTTKAATSGSTTASSGAADDVKIVQGPELRNFNGSTATLFWVTNNVAASDVRYGADPNKLDQRAYEAGGAREHSLQLTNLQAGRTYYFEILRRNSTVRQTGSFQLPNMSGQMTASSMATHPAIPVQMGPFGANVGTATSGAIQITNGPVVEYVSDNTAVVAWATNMKASSIVRYGTTPWALNQEAQGSWGDTMHRVTISNLQANTRYFFRVESSPAEGTGTVARSQTSIFQTVAPGAQARGTRR